jgi:snRNA-activating protein complex subunit 3
MKARSLTRVHSQPEAPTEPVDSEDVVLSIALYHPSKNTKTQEYRVLGQQSLTALRDKLYCLSDHMLEGPKIKSGYFFVEHTFYNDMRHQPNADYSKYVHVTCVVVTPVIPAPAPRTHSLTRVTGP